VKHEGRRFGTPLLLALVAARPPIWCSRWTPFRRVRVTDDPFLVFSSNICALPGLRALYFVVRGALRGCATSSQAWRRS